MRSRNLLAPLRLTLALLLVAAAPSLAAARGGHGRSRHARVHAMPAGRDVVSADPKAANDDRLRSTSEDIDKVLDAKIKNICRGC